jgi:hypothetical protein
MTGLWDRIAETGQSGQESLDWIVWRGQSGQVYWLGKLQEFVLPELCYHLYFRRTGQIVA